MLGFSIRNTQVWFLEEDHQLSTHTRSAMSFFANYACMLIHIHVAGKPPMTGGDTPIQQQSTRGIASYSKLTVTLIQLVDCIENPPVKADLPIKNGDVWLPG